MIQTEKAHLPVTAQTHEGMRGKNNEDRFAVASFQMGPSYGGLPVMLAVVSDGVGGHRAGEVASEMAVNMVSNSVGQSDGSTPLKTLEHAIWQASNQIVALGQTNADFEGMGATIACVMVVGHRLYTATVGDSRIYLLRNGLARQISIDHTWIQEALDAGLIDPGEVAGHPNSHVIRRYLGSPRPPEVDFRMRLENNESDAHALTNQGMQLKAGDRLVICTDGLSDLVSAPEIFETFNKKPLESAAATLVDLANSRGGHDNITIVALDVPNSASRLEHLLTPRNISLVLIGLLIAIALIAAIAVGWLIFGWFAPQLTASGTSILQPVIINRTTALPAGTQTTPQATFTLDPGRSFDVLSQPTVSPGPVYRTYREGQATLTPWPTNTLSPTSTATLLSSQTTETVQTQP
ncbi:MAG: protein phosphatase 2C domain-containing protein [Anaerolineae bacterium]|nr:protein phosphatase 2C domain-containing protein [Anaerolineae bacterium]